MVSESRPTKFEEFSKNFEYGQSWNSFHMDAGGKMGKGLGGVKDSVNGQSHGR